jgi:4'-phosphopantetheinyl transferase
MEVARPAAPLTLAPDEIQVWFCAAETIEPAHLVAAYHQLMDEPERVQQARYHFAKHRHQYLVTRALTRTVLSRYLTVAPAELRFVRNEYGRPELSPGFDTSPEPLRFNLSHTDGLEVLAVTRGVDLGADVEVVRPDPSLILVADRFFSPSEVAALRALPEAEQIERFFTYWTLKESYIKARGMGLAIPLDQFSFHLEERPRIAFAPELKDDPSSWQFWATRVTGRHRFALAVRSRKRVTVTACKVVPLAGETPVSIERVPLG